MAMHSWSSSDFAVAAVIFIIVIVAIAALLFVLSKPGAHSGGAFGKKSAASASSTVSRDGEIPAVAPEDGLHQSAGSSSNINVNVETAPNKSSDSSSIVQQGVMMHYLMSAEHGAKDVARGAENLASKAGPEAEALGEDLVKAAPEIEEAATVAVEVAL